MYYDIFVRINILHMKGDNTMSTFCPFAKGNCIAECVFNNGCFNEGDPENCNLMDAIRNIQSDGFDDRTPRDYIESIEDKLQSINSNTSSDQTESWSIKSELEDISSKLDKIMKKI